MNMHDMCNVNTISLRSYLGCFLRGWDALRLETSCSTFIVFRCISPVVSDERSSVPVDPAKTRYSTSSPHWGVSKVVAQAQ